MSRKKRSVMSIFVCCMVVALVLTQYHSKAYAGWFGWRLRISEEWDVMLKNELIQASMNGVGSAIHTYPDCVNAIFYVVRIDGKYNLILVEENLNSDDVHSGCIDWCDAWLTFVAIETACETNLNSVTVMFPAHYYSISAPNGWPTQSELEEFTKTSYGWNYNELHKMGFSNEREAIIKSRAIGLTNCCDALGATKPFLLSMVLQELAEQFELKIDMEPIELNE